jgi:glycogen operon protein
MDWDLDDERRALLAFTQRLVRLRTEHPALRRAKFFKGRQIHGADIKDIVWLRHDGEAMNEEDWRTPYTRALGMLIAGNGLDEVDERGVRLTDDDLLLLVNGGHEGLDFAMPNLVPDAANWTLLVDTNAAGPDGAPPDERVPADGKTHLVARSLRLFARPASGGRPTVA